MGRNAAAAADANRADPAWVPPQPWLANIGGSATREAGARWDVVAGCDSTCPEDSETKWTSSVAGSVVEEGEIGRLLASEFDMVRTAAMMVVRYGSMVLENYETVAT